MKLKIREGNPNSICDNEFHLVYCQVDSNNDYDCVVAQIGDWKDRGYDPAFLARLFQSAEELLELAEYALRQRLFDDGYPYTRDSLKKTVDYIKTGDKDDIVTVKYDGDEIKMKKRAIRKLRDALDNLLK